jgi:GT2 family glycosyltransferase
VHYSVNNSAHGNIVYVVILNWNGWQDTVDCLNSLLNSDNDNIKIVICDNGSSDNSIEEINNWCSAEYDIGVANISAGETNGNASAASSTITLIYNQDNLGFAAGNNTGLRYALAQQDMSHVWLLNNDTEVAPECLSAMLTRLENFSKPAICGSRIMFHEDIAIVQALGGNTFNKYTGIAGQSLGRFGQENSPRDTKKIEGTIDYLSGCSILLPRSFLETIGLMDEQYFLYYEEIDWAVRANKQFANIYADDAVVYHKEGASIGSASLTTAPSLLSEFYCNKSKLLFMKKHYPLNLPWCYLALLGQVFNRCRRRQWHHGYQLLSIIFGKQSF